MTYLRSDGRATNALRPIKITRNYNKYAEGSVLVEFGETKVICTASIEDRIPHHKKGTGSGWLTAEYSMIPRATHTRSNRPNAAKPKARSLEIQRLIGRSLRAICNLNLLGERTITIDTDVIQADGGTRTAAITGSFVALQDAISYLLNNKIIENNPIKDFLAAISVGIVEGEVLLDLAYDEDSTAQVDMNVVMTDSGRFVELQGTAENEPFSKEMLDMMLSIASIGIEDIIKIQKKELMK